MKTTLIIILITLVSYSCVDKTRSTKNTLEPIEKAKYSLSRYGENVYFYKSDSLYIKFSTIKRIKKIDFNICIESNNDTFNLKGVANLILIENENGKLYVPEGSFILDSDTNEEYLCDSTYEYISDKLCFSCGFEKSTNRRISLVIYDSKIDFIRDNEYTLHKK